MERAALLDLAGVLEAKWLPGPGGEAPAGLADLAGAAPTPDALAKAVQDDVYAVGKRHPLPALKAWFDCLYQVLLGQEEGPRFGGFVVLYGVAETVALIRSRLASRAAADAGSVADAA